MKKILGIVLLVGSIGLGYYGFKQYKESQNSIGIGGLEVSLDNKEGKTNGLLFMGAAVLMLGAGIVLVRK